MAARYLRRMPLLSTRNLVVLGDMLGDEEVSISASECKRLAEGVNAAQRRLQIADPRRQAYMKEIEEFRVGGKPVLEDVALAMLSVMLHRYDKRRGQPSMFGDDDDPEPSRPVTANSSVYEAARPTSFRDSTARTITGSTTCATRVRRTPSSSFNSPLCSSRQRPPRSSAPSRRSSPPRLSTVSSGNGGIRSSRGGTSLNTC